MAPSPPHFVRSTISSGAADAASQLRSQWENPSNVASILLIVAGDIVGQALDQLSGPSIVPVVFSFGWVSYAHKAFTNAIGLHRLLNPKHGTGKDGERGSCVIDIRTGRKEACKSIILEQVLRDFDHWKPAEVKEDDDQYVLHAARSGSEHDSIAREPQSPRDCDQDGVNDVDDDPFASLNHPLRITVFDASAKSLPNSSSHDHLWIMGILCALIQLGIAAIPCGLRGDFTILLVTGVGTILAFATGSLPQFGAEKWGPKKERAKSSRTIALADGDMRDASEVLVIEHLPSGIDGSDLESAGDWDAQVLRRRTAQNPTAWPWTRSATGLLAACWIVLLIIVSGLRGNSWYLLGVGFLGMLQNGFVAASPRTPQARGLSLRFIGLIQMQPARMTLLEAERHYQGVGAALLRSICPDTSKAERRRWWTHRGISVA